MDMRSDKLDPAVPFWQPNSILMEIPQSKIFSSNVGYFMRLYGWYQDHGIIPCILLVNQSIKWLVFQTVQPTRFNFGPLWRLYIFCSIGVISSRCTGSKLPKLPNYGLLSFRWPPHLRFMLVQPWILVSGLRWPNVFHKDSRPELGRRLRGVL
jgi:hypothetical protein